MNLCSPPNHPIPNTFPSICFARTYILYLSYYNLVWNCDLQQVWTYLLVQNIHSRPYKPNSWSKPCVLWQCNVFHNQILNISEKSCVCNDIPLHNANANSIVHHTCQFHINFYKCIFLIYHKSSVWLTRHGI